MKMISSTSMTSMNGVTLISWISARSSSPCRAVTPWVTPPRARCATAGRHDAAALRSRSRLTQPQHFRGRIAQQRAIAGDPARKHIVDHDGRDGRDQAERGREQRLGDAGRDDGEVRRLRFRDADEAVHDAPDGAEQADERAGRADGGENAGAARHAPARCRLDALESATRRAPSRPRRTSRRPRGATSSTAARASTAVSPVDPRSAPAASASDPAWATTTRSRRV